MQNRNVEGQITLFDPGIWCGKTSPEPSPAESQKGRTSASFWKRSSELKSIPYLSLDLTPGTGNLLGESYWETLSPWRGDASMLGTGVSPSDEKESSLSQILQAAVPSRYYLTPKACQGILRRADERGKKLPQKLKRALEIQAGIALPDGNSTELEAYHINQRDEGINLHGVSGALMATSNMQMQTFVTQPEVAGSGNLRPNDQGPCVREREHRPLAEREAVLCIAGNTIDRQPQNGGNGLGCQEDLAYTLTATDHHAVFSRQRVDMFKGDSVASTQSARQYKDATDLIYDAEIFGQSQFGNYASGCATLRAQGGDHGGGSENLVTRTNQSARRLIRRLTPLECERLQGFPDGWTDIPGALDAARYKALGNSVAIPCVDYVLHGIALALRAGWKTEKTGSNNDEGRQKECV